MIRKILTVFALLGALPHSASAATTDWSKTEGGQLRLIALPPEKDGTVHAVLQIAPDAGWHTYWKVPGSSGIAPQISVKQGGNISLEKVDYPPPQVFTAGTSRDFGYDRPVMLPLTFKQTEPGKPSRIDANVFVGLCGQVCIPFQTEFNLGIAPGDAAPARETALLGAARASLPEPPANDFKVEDSRLSPDGRTVTIKLVLPPGADPASSSFIITSQNGDAFQKAKLVNQDGQSITLSAAPVFLDDGKTLKGETVELLAEAAGRTMQTSFLPQ